MAMGRAPHGRRARRAAMAEINVTPLVDVMLVLLVIFMVTAPLLKAGVPVELPDSRAHPLTEAPHQVAITMAYDGKTYLDDAELAPGELPDRIAALPRGPDGKLPPVLLRADRALDYGRVIGLMGELNRAGVTAISLVTQSSATAPVSSGSAAKPESPIR